LPPGRYSFKMSSGSPWVTAPRNSTTASKQVKASTPAFYASQTDANTHFFKVVKRIRELFDKELQSCVLRLCECLAQTTFADILSYPFPIYSDILSRKKWVWFFFVF
jgi:hypothetical protein